MRSIILMGALVLGGCAHISLPTVAGDCLAPFPVKGNADSSIYHTPKSPYYTRTKAEVCFDTEEAAIKNGFYKWYSPRQRY